jgi:hypothetical protein
MVIYNRRANWPPVCLPIHVKLASISVLIAVINMVTVILNGAQKRTKVQFLCCTGATGQWGYIIENFFLNSLTLKLP